MSNITVRQAIARLAEETDAEAIDTARACVSLARRIVQLEWDASVSAERQVGSHGQHPTGAEAIEALQASAERAWAWIDALERRHHDLTQRVRALELQAGSESELQAARPQDGGTIIAEQPR